MVVQCDSDLAEWKTSIRAVLVFSSMYSLFENCHFYNSNPVLHYRIPEYPTLTALNKTARIWGTTRNKISSFPKFTFPVFLSKNNNKPPHMQRSTASTHHLATQIHSVSLTLNLSVWAAHTSFFSISDPPGNPPLPSKTHPSVVLGVYLFTSQYNIFCFPRNYCVIGG